MSYSVCIFDLDGVIVDTASLHFAAWQRLAKELGFELTPADNELLKGVSREESLRIVLSLGGISPNTVDLQMLADRKNAWYVESLSLLSIDNALPGAVDFVQSVRASGIKTALASASRNAGLILASLGISGLFDAVVDGNSGLPAKPAPDLFLSAARTLRAEPRECIVFEDAAAGVEAALNGMFRVVGVGHSEYVGEADVIIQNFTGLTPDVLLLRMQFAEYSALRREWLIRERDLCIANTAAHETRFVQSNGSFALRGRSPFLEPADPACFVAGAYDDFGSTVKELAILPDPTLISIFVDNEKVDISSSLCCNYQRILDMERALVIMSCSIRTSSNAEIEVKCERFVSAADDTLWAERWILRAIGSSKRILVLNSIDGTLRNSDKHPLEAAKHFRVEQLADTGSVLCLSAALKQSDKHFIFSSMVEVPAVSSASRVACRVQAESIEEVWAMDVECGCEYVFYRYGKIQQIVEASNACKALAAAGDKLGLLKQKGYASLLAAHETIWRRKWQKADVHIAGDLPACRALRFNLFHLMQSVHPSADSVSIGAKGLHGQGYKGHVFWDTETFMLPFFVYSDPAAARRLLSYRWLTLAGARRNAAAGGFKGARFAWESADDGSETTPRWGVDYAGNSVRIWTGDEEVHIGADIAHAVYVYHEATGDDRFMEECGLELIFSIAEFFDSLAVYDPSDGCRHIKNVIGTDEFHEHIDDDAFTNYMAIWTLRTASVLMRRYEATTDAGFQRKLKDWGIAAQACARWTAAADELLNPFDLPAEGIVEQFKGYFSLPDWPITSWDSNGMPEWPGGLDLAALGNTRLLKQPDVIQVFALLPEDFSAEFMHANYNFYEQRTMHKSSLSPSIHAMVGVRLGETARAYEYFMKTVQTDLVDNQGNAGLGFHAASAGGAWQAAICGFGGFSIGRNPAGMPLPVINPWLPSHWHTLRYNLQWRHASIQICIDRSTIVLTADKPVSVMVGGKEFSLQAGLKISVPRSLLAVSKA